MGLNENGELLENTLIFDDGSVIFVNEYRMDDIDKKMLDGALHVLKMVEREYGTLNIFDLMDANIPKKDMFRYLCALRLCHMHGLDRDKNMGLNGDR